MRVAIIGYGAVAGMHARGLRAGGKNVLASVTGPDAAKAEQFAKTYGVGRSGTDMVAGLRDADAAIICSPSQFHYEQAAETLRAGVHALVELPACSSTHQAAQLYDSAKSSRLQLECAHTGRYLAPYVFIGDWIRRGMLGEIQQLIYVRLIEPRSRSWTSEKFFRKRNGPSAR